MKDNSNSKTAKFLIFVPIIGFPAILLSWTILHLLVALIGTDPSANWILVINYFLGLIGLILTGWLMIGLPYGIYLLKESETKEQKNAANVEFYSTSALKIALLSIATFGIYNLYWCYKNWKIIKKRDTSNIMPFWRAFFIVIFIYPLFGQIQASIKKVGTTSFSAGWLTVLFIFFLQFSASAVDAVTPSTFIYYFTFIPLIIVQNTVNEYNSKINPKYEVNSRFSVPQVLLIIVGILIALSVLSSFVPTYY